MNHKEHIAVTALTRYFGCVRNWPLHKTMRIKYKLMGTANTKMTILKRSSFSSSLVWTDSDSDESNGIKFQIKVNI